MKKHIYTLDRTGKLIAYIASLISIILLIRFIIFLTQNFVPVFFLDDWTVAWKLASSEHSGFTFTELNRSHNGHRILFLNAIYIIDVIAKTAGWISYVAVIASALIAALFLGLIALRAGLPGGSALLLVVPLAALAGTAPHLKETLIWAFGLPTIVVFTLIFGAGYCLLRAREQNPAPWIVAALLCVLASTQSLASGLIGGAILLLAMWPMGFKRREIMIYGLGFLLIIIIFYAPFPTLGPRGSFGSIPSTLYGRLEHIVGTITTGLGSPFLAIDKFRLPISLTQWAGGSLFTVMAVWGLTLLRPRNFGRQSPAFILLFALMAFAAATPVVLALSTPEVNSWWIVGGGRYAMAGLWFWVLSIVIIAVLIAERWSIGSSRAFLGLAVLGASWIYASAITLAAPKIVEHSTSLRDGGAALVVGVADPKAIRKLFPYGSAENFVRMAAWARPVMQRQRASIFATEDGELIGRSLRNIVPSSASCLARIEGLATNQFPELAQGSSPATTYSLEGTIDGRIVPSGRIVAVDRSMKIVGLGFIQWRAEDFRLRRELVSIEPRRFALFSTQAPEEIRLFQLGGDRSWDTCELSTDVR